MNNSRTTFLLIALFGALISVPENLATQLHAQETKTYGPYSLKEWQHVVKSTDFTTLGQPAIVDGLIEIVVDEKAPWASRRQAAKPLGRIGQPAAKAVPILKEILLNPGDDAVSTRLWVLSALSLFKTVARDVTPEVSELVLDSQQPHLIRVNAMETLGRVGKESELSLSTFSTLLQSHATQEDNSQNELRLAAADAVWILGPSAAPLLPLLIENARDEWSAIRIASLTSIGEIGPPAAIAIPPLVDTLLFDDSDAVREVAADSLGKIGSPAIPVLAKLQTDPELQVRLYVVRAISQMASQTGVSKLLRIALQDEADAVKIEAAQEVLNREPDHALAQTILLDALDNQDRRVRLNAYNAIYEQLPKSETLQIELSFFAVSDSATKIEREAAIKLLKKFQFDQE